MNKDDKVRDILARFGEDMSSTWMVQGQRVIYHSALERIAAKAKISWDEPVFLISSAEHAVIKASGHLPYEDHDRGTARWEWSVGEAHIGVNYRVSGKQAPYPFAMAEKRAKDRVILKLIELHGLLYSEEEADDFRKPTGWESDGPTPKPGDKAVMPDGSVVALGRVFSRTGDSGEALKSKIREGMKEYGMEPGLIGPAKEARREIMFDAISSGKPIVLDDGEVHPGDALTRLIREQGTAIGIKNLMLRHEVQTYLSGIPEDQKDELRNFALARMADLGWKKSNG
jgi:hypothetical protein